MNDECGAPASVGLVEIFLTFLVIGATSVGGGVLAYLRDSLVRKRRWLDDPTFVQMVSISQSLPGLNATNMAVLVGDRLRGLWGSVAALVGICLPGGLLMFGAGVAYGIHAERPAVAAILHGVAAAAVGLSVAVAFQLGRKSISRMGDLVFVALAVLGINVFHLQVPWVLLGVGALAILWHRPRRARAEGAAP
jgi:chromate transporter